jgi:hypothetical protein
MRRNVSFSLTQLGFAAAVLGAVSLVSPRAAAQDDVTLTMARERFKEGVTYFDKKDFAKARVAFLQAYALKKHPAVLLNLAQSELRSAHEADAAQHFTQYWREHKDASEAERQSAEAGLVSARALVAEVTLDVDANGAEVHVDGEAAGTTPLPAPLFLAPGSHRIQVRKDGKTTNSDIAVAAGQATKFSVKLAAPAVTAPPPTPVTARPAEETASPPPDTEPPSADEPMHRVSFGRWLGKTPGAMVGVGLTGVGLIGGTAFALGSRSAYGAADRIAGQIEDKAVNYDKKPNGQGVCVKPESWLKDTALWGGTSPDRVAAREDRARQYKDNCDRYEDNVSSGDKFKTVAIVSFAVAGAAALGTIIYYIVDSKEPAGQARGAAKRRIMVLPVYQSGYSGALISGTF